MRAIADKIGYTATAIYYHFKDKDDLLRELCYRDFSQLGHIIAQASTIKDPIERIRRTGLAYIDFGLENPSQYKFMFMTKHEHQHAITPEMIPIDKTNPEESAYAFLQQCVADAINERRFRPELCDDANHIANMLWSSVHGVVSLHLVKRDDPWVDWGDPRRLAEMMVDTVIRGIAVPQK
jgi:AcrR family transcriptional regulator